MNVTASAPIAVLQPLFSLADLLLDVVLRFSLHANVQETIVFFLAL